MLTLEQIENKIDKTVELLGKYPFSSAIADELERLCELKNEWLADMGLEEV